MNWKKFRRKMRRWIRRHRYPLLMTCAMLIISALLLIPPVESGGSGDYSDFLDALAMRESSGDHEKVNRYGYMGLYQMGRSALEDAGFRHEGGDWTPLANSYGIYDQDDFLQSPDAQNAAVTAYHAKVCMYIRHYDLEKYIGTTYCDVPVTRSGLLAACHLVGIGAVIDGLKSGQHTYDGNHTSAAEYMELFSGYDISAVWDS
ncbi:MAG: hypothetical protein IJZ39_10195 [Oscillospiraceae bacterium]|nr:hypothetical protein [Oscillospiraceae bacterium]